MSETLLLSREDVRRVYGTRQAIESQRVAFRSIASGEARAAPRLLLPGETGRGDTVFCYLARLPGQVGAVCKFGSVNPANQGRSLPAVSAVIIALDGASGQPIAIMDGTYITQMRTAAGTAVAAECLTTEGPHSLLVIGCGVQGHAHVQSLSEVLSLDTIRVWSPRPGERRSAALRLSTELGRAVEAPDDLPDAAASADIIVTCTTSTTPVLATSWLSPGATVLSIGSFAPDRCETDQDLLERAALVVVDDVPTACAQAGPIVKGTREGSIREADLVPLSDVVQGNVKRARPADIVYFNSVGIGIQDAAAAGVVIEAARSIGIGVKLPLQDYFSGATYKTTQPCG